jgi:pyruvate kinase
MDRICLSAEKETEEGSVDRRLDHSKFTRIDQSIAMSALYAASHFKVKAIVALTQSGSTALWMSRINGNTPIYAMTPTESTLSKVTLFSGVYPIAFKSDSKDYSVTLRQAEDELERQGLVEDGDLMVMTVGESIGKAGHTNTMKIVRVGDHRKS